MLLNPHGIEPTSLHLNSWSPGVAFIPIITTNNVRIKEEKISFMYTIKFNAFFLNGFNPVLGSIPRLTRVACHKLCLAPYFARISNIGSIEV